MCSGIWPPSKPLMATPDRLFWPFWPRPEVLPRPEPMPRPTRVRALRAPGLSAISLSFMACTSLFLDPHHVLDLFDHAADRRRVFQFAGAIHLVQAQADQSRALALLTADRAADLRHLDRLLTGHNY